MARAKKHKQNEQRRYDFFEALPVSITPPAILPSDSDRIVREVLALLQRKAQSLVLSIASIKWVKHWHFDLPNRAQVAAVWNSALHLVRAAAVAAAENVEWAGRVTVLGAVGAYSIAATGARLSTDAVITYTPPLLDDLRVALRRLRRALGGRLARRLYLSLAILSFGALTTLAVITAVNTVSAYASIISSPTTILSNRKTGITIEDESGKVLYQSYGASDATNEPLSKIPQNLVDATLSAEDPGFYSEPGISIRGTLRAAYVDLVHNGSAVQGGSTLTEQLVKNTVLAPNRSYWRKYQEILLSLDLDQRYSKNQILDMYLNETDYGEGSTGVQVASQTYFHKPVWDLSLGQAALIAGLPLGPSRFDPNVSLAEATGRRNYVLGRMAQLGKITKGQAAAAEAQPIVLAGTSSNNSSDMVVYAQNQTIQAPWFVFYVLSELRQYYTAAQLENDGMTVKTTLNLTDENNAEQDVAQQVAALKARNVTDGALVSLQPKTGNILAMVGSAGWNIPGYGEDNATTALLQPGSSFKPIVYVAAFEKGWNGNTTVDDAPIDIAGYSPTNYDLQYHGIVTLRHALDNSLNVPAVKVMQFVGVPDALTTARDLGITTLNQPTSDYGLSLVLGAGDVEPIQMAEVYATFDNLGTRVEPRSILAIYNRDGKDVTPQTFQPSTPQQVLNPDYAYMITNILSDAQAREPEFPANSALTLDRPAAAKTGTTNDFDDNWTIGYTPQLVTAVWVGNSNHTPMNDNDGLAGAGPIWHDFMEQALAGQPSENFTMPAGDTIATVCEPSDVNQGFTPTQQEVFLSGQAPSSCNNNSNANANIADNSNGNSNADQTPSPSPAPNPTPSPTPPAPTPIPQPTPNENEAPIPANIPFAPDQGNQGP